MVNLRYTGVQESCRREAEVAAYSAILRWDVKSICAGLYEAQGDVFMYTDKLTFPGSDVRVLQEEPSILFLVNISGNKRY